MDLLGFMERLRGGWIENDDEMLLLTLREPSTRRQKQDALAHRLRLAFAILCEYGAAQGVSPEALESLFQAANRPAVGQAKKTKAKR